MNAYTFPTVGMARRFARNARGRGYAAKVAGCVVRLERVDPQLRLLAQRYAGLKVRT